jgi:hypothetical protein
VASFFELLGDNEVDAVIILRRHMTMKNNNECYVDDNDNSFLVFFYLSEPMFAIYAKTNTQARPQINGSNFVC